MKRTIWILLLVACVAGILSGCESTMEQVDKTDKWLDGELHKMM